jgi:predicted RNA-binding Zn-ribbon protein involved in translation (DUF1610 family)
VATGAQVSIYGPLIDRTHQTWKLHVANTGVVLALAIHAVPRWFRDVITPQQLAIYSGISALVAATGVFIYFGTVRCPVCGAHWVWRAAKQRAVRWLEWLHEQQVCPVCGSSGDRAPDDR